MKSIKRFLNSSLAGTVMIGCASLVLFLSLFGILIIIRRGAFLPAPTATPTIPVPTKILPPTEVPPTPITFTATAIVIPTRTPVPTKVSITATLPAVTTSPIPTAQPIQATPARSCVPGRPPQVGKVLDAIDGDTISVLLDGLEVKVKYIGVDAPESLSRLEYLGKEAKARNRELIFGRDVLLYGDVTDRDRFDQLLRYAFVNDKFINYELVSQGYASALDEPPNSACALLFKDAETSVKEQALGIWAPHTPLPELSLAAGSMIIFGQNKEGEFVDLQNVGDIAIDLSGWKLVSEVGSQECQLSGVIHPYEIVRIFSGIDQPGFSCGFDKPIWEDDEPDPAVLYDPDRNEVDRYP